MMWMLSWVDGWTQSGYPGRADLKPSSWMGMTYTEEGQIETVGELRKRIVCKW